jgi:hypothetical protein
MATETLRPNAVGDLTEWTAQYPTPGNHYDKVYEAVADEDATFIVVYSYITTPKTDLYNIPDSAIPEGSTINSVTVYFRHRGEYYTYARCAAAMKTGGTQYNGDYETSTSSYVTSSKTWTTNPKTGVAWTVDDINALQIGVVGKRGVYYDFDLGVFYYDNTYCTQVYVVINYTLAVVAVPKMVGDGLTCVLACLSLSVKLGKGDFKRG